MVTFSLSGVSSVNDEEIMSETYRVIAANFKAVTLTEAKMLIDAVRNWGPVEPAFEVARRHPDDALLQAAVARALGAPLASDAGFTKRMNLAWRLLDRVRCRRTVF